MDKKAQQNQIQLDGFNDVSLWQLLPCGNGHALKKLKEIVNSELNSHPNRSSNKPFSLLISGPFGKRTHTFAVLRALGYQYIEHIPAALLSNITDLVEFFRNSNPETGYVISDLHSMNTALLKKYYQVLTEGNLITYNYNTHEKLMFPVLSPVIMTIKYQNKVPPYLNECFNYSVELGEYTTQQKELIALQRLKYANIEIQDEEVLKTLMLYSLSDLNDLIKLLDLSIMVMMGEGKNVLTIPHIKRGKELF